MTNIILHVQLFLTNGNGSALHCLQTIYIQLLTTAITIYFFIMLVMTYFNGLQQSDLSFFEKNLLSYMHKSIHRKL